MRSTPHSPGRTPPRRRRCAGAALAVLLGFAACEAPPAPVVEPDRLESGVWSVDFESHRGLVMRRRGDPRGIATIRHVRLVLGAERSVHHLPLRQARRQGETLVLTCAPHPDHELVVSIRPDGHDALRVEVRDEVALRSLIHEITIEYELPSDWPPNETWLPHMHATPEEVCGDGSFRVPLAYLRHGARALAWLPDLALLARHRRLPQALELDTGTDGDRHTVRVRHGLVSYSVPDRADGGFRRGEAPPLAATGEQLLFAHRLRLIEPAGHQTLDEVVRDIWAAAAPAAAPPTGTTLDHASEEFFRRLLADSWVATPGREKSGSLRTGRPEAAGAAAPIADTWFTGEQQTLRTAFGLALFAARTGAPDLLERVRQVVASALTANSVSGLRPAILLLDPERREHRWVVQPEGSPAPGHYHVLDSATSYLWLLRLLAFCPERRGQVLAECQKFARFMRLSQHPSGAFPSFFDARDLRVRKGPLYEHSAETGAMARFLFEFAAVTGDEDAMASGRRAVGWITRQLDGGVWIDHETIRAPGPELDPRSGMRRDGTFGLIQCALATLRLEELDPDPARLATVHRLLARLARHQQVWSPPWITGAVAGGMGAGNFDHRWNDARQSLAALAYFDGYRMTGDAHWLERGVAALRAGLACGAQEYQPARDGAGPASTPLWGTGTACTVAEMVRGDLGQGVVDLRLMRAEGIDAVWFDGFEPRDPGGAIDLWAWTHAQGLDSVLVRFRNVPAAGSGLRLQVNQESVGVFSAEQLTAGVRVRPAFVPLIDYRPPLEISRLVDWRPRAMVLRQDAPPRARLEIRVGDGAVESVPLVLASDQPLLRVSAPVNLHANLPVGSEVNTRVSFDVAGRTFTVPREGSRVSTVREFDRIDPGEGDELELVESGKSRLRQFPDGLERGRHLEPGGHATYRVTVPTGATHLDLTARISGRMRIRTGDTTLHEDELTGGVRDVDLGLADHRLWADGNLPLTFETAGPDAAADLAWIRHTARGRTFDTTAVGKTRPSRDPKRELRILVQPVQLLDRPLDVDRESVRLAFFGGEDYRMTPPPDSRRTAGSARQFLETLAGGRTTVTGTVLERSEWELVVADLGKPRIRLREELARRVAADEPDVVVLVLGRGRVPASPGRAQVGARTVPVAFLPARDAEGFLACGRIVDAVLRACFGTSRLDTPDQGNFGDLALSSASNNHLPPGPCSINLVKTGWADLLDLEGMSLDDLPISPLLPGRKGYVFKSFDLPGRGRLLLETRAIPAQQQPQPDRTGALLYWELDRTRTLLRDVGGRRCTPHILRLSSQHSFLSTPHVPGTPADLFAVPSAQLPTETLTGERVWQVTNYQPQTLGQATVDIRFLPVDLLRNPTATWRTETPTGGVLRRQARVRIDLLPGETRRLEAPARTVLTRMFCRIEQVRGQVELTAGAGDERLQATLTQARRPRWTEIDLPVGPPLFVALKNPTASPASIDLGSVLVVPRIAALHDIRPTGVEVEESVQLLDGVLYGAALHLPPAPRGQVVTAPLLLPQGPIALRIRAGLQAGGAPVKLTLTVRDKTGSGRVTLLDEELIHPTDGDAGLFLGLFELAPGTADRVEFLEIRWQGASSLYVVDLGIVRA